MTSSRQVGGRSPRPARHANGAPESATRFHLLHNIFETQADARPKAVAVRFGREETTYGELEQRANRLARCLRARGVRRGSLVAMLLPRSADAYAALLGILKAGAAYVPLDPEYPADRVAYVLKDCAAAALLTTADLVGPHAAFGGVIIRVDADRAAIDAESSARLPTNPVGVGPRDLCYVIYTSGSTGRPKGVMIEHRSACHLVCAEGRIFGVRAEDRVYQGFSLAFDASVEEVWLAFHAGATLVAATPEMAHAGPDLSRMLSEAGVTVLSCVPTLLAMLAEAVPTLRLLIFGGETCPERLVARWARPGLRMVNTYGPTEATVIATYAELAPGKPVTLGRAVPGYRVHLLDERLRPVPPGEPGEICIGGDGVARGYVGLPEQTRARFVPDPFAPRGGADARLYRTGDLGRFDSDGNIEFLGRADSQVKLRGYRVELAEIESVLMQGDGILAAACAVRQDLPGVPQLVGYVVPRDGGPVDEERLRSHLRDRLPAYMVPALIETVPDLPRLPSGKLDRASLPAPRSREPAPNVAAARARADTERRIAEVWEALFRPQPVGVDDNFFLDLGGHSLLAARMVSELRKEPRFGRVSMLDLYAHPTIASLASALDAGAPRPQSQRALESPTVSRDQSRANEPRRHFLAGVLQSVGLYFVFGFGALRWVTPYLVFCLMQWHGVAVIESIAWAAGITMMMFPAMFLFAVATKWLVLGRIRAGRYPLWGHYHLRWWLVQNLVGALHVDHLDGTPLMGLIYRLLGAQIGRDVHLETHDLAAFDLISIGDGTSVDEHVSMLGYTVEGRELVIGPVRIGSRCFLGARSVVRENAVMEDEARLEDQSLLPRGSRIPRGETWAGSPARRVAGPKSLPEPPVRGPLQRAVILAAYAGLVTVFPILALSAFVPGVAMLIQIDWSARPLLYLAAAPVVGASFVLTLTTGTVLLKRLLIGRARAGTYPLHGGFYMRKWIIDQLLALSLEVAGGLHATLYLAPWYRALGAKLGRFVELSTATSMTPDMLEIGDGGTVADEASLGAARIERGWLTLAPTRLGRRAFVGNGAVVPQGTTLGDDSLVGVVSIAPTDPDEAARTGASWLGSPPIALPRRQQSAPFPEQTTYCPTRKLRLQRGAFEILRVTLPPAGFILVMATVVNATLEVWGRFGPVAALLALPLAYEVCCAALALGVVTAKWAIMGRFRPFQHPQWSWYVWRLEFVNALYEFMITPLALNALQGTPFLPWYYRLLGSRIGRRTYFHTTGLIEFDLVEVGDEAVLNEDSVLQAHLFEDRILKASWMRIGRGCEVGAGSVVLYDTEMEDGSRLDALSLLMKGERLPAGTAWAGSPASWSGTIHSGSTPSGGHAAPEQREIPDDSALPALEAIRTAGLTGAVPSLDLDRGGPVEFSVRRYKPGSRATIEVRAGNRRLTVKAYANDPGPEAVLYRALERAGLAGDSGSRVPPLLAWDGDLRVLILGWLDGLTAQQLIQSGQGARAGELGARWLRRVATLSVKIGPPFGATHVLNRARKWVAALGAADPELGNAGSALTGMLARTRPQEGAPRLVHGTLYCRHVLDLGNGPGVIDWRRFGQGPMELDAGTFLATIWRLGLRHRPLAGEATRAQEVFLAESAGLVEERALAWHRAGALLRLAGRLARRPGDYWQAEIRAMLGEAKRLAESIG